MTDDRLHVVSIMNFPPDERHRRMCHAFLDSVLAAGAERVTVFHDDQPPPVTADHLRAGVEVRPGTPKDVGHPHFNLRFKLPTLAGLTEPFVFLDADTYVLGDLRELWAVRHDKPWIGIDHQWIPSDPRTHRPLFLNSGVQIVGDPGFYDLDAMLAVQEAAAPLRLADLSLREDPKTFLTTGRDQSVIERYFRAIGYDYTHPAIGPEWNSCAGVTKVWRDGDKWAARTAGLTPDYDVKLVHYWDQFKPWLIDDPIHAAYAATSAECRVQSAE